MISASIKNQARKGVKMLITKYSAFLANFHLDGAFIVLRLYMQFDWEKLFQFCPIIHSERAFCIQICNNSIKSLKQFLCGRWRASNPLSTSYVDCNPFFWIDEFIDTVYLTVLLDKIQMSNIERAFAENKICYEADYYSLEDQKIFSCKYHLQLAGENIDGINLNMVQRVSFCIRKNEPSDMKQVQEWGLDYAQ